MKTKSKQQSDAIQTDHLARTDDRHINKGDKQHLKASDEAKREMNPGKSSKVPAPESVRQGKRRKT